MGGSISLETGCANRLADDVVMAGSLVTFKAKLDHQLRNVRGFVQATAFSRVFCHPGFY